MRSPDDRDDEPPRGAEPDQPSEDRAAILSRRAFLIESALASAGITVALAGCEREKKPAVPQECLKVAPRVCLKVAPQMCLKVAPQPRICLSERPTPKPPAARPCLEMMPPKRRPDGGA